MRLRYLTFDRKISFKNCGKIYIVVKINIFYYVSRIFIMFHEYLHDFSKRLHADWMQTNRYKLRLKKKGLENIKKKKILYKAIFE